MSPSMRFTPRATISSTRALKGGAALAGMMTGLEGIDATGECRISAGDQGYVAVEHARVVWQRNGSDGAAPRKRYAAPSLARAKAPEKSLVLEAGGKNRFAP